MEDSSRGKKVWKRKQRKPAWLVCIDPGGITGWAVFKGGKLTSCGYSKFEDAIWMAPAVPKTGVFLLEVPVAYPGARSKADPNDLIVTALRGGEFRFKYRALCLDLEEITPKDWKGTISKPKSVSEPYLITERVLEKLDEEELKVLYRNKSPRAAAIDHNMIDAVGMGLWRLCR